MGCSTYSSDVHAARAATRAVTGTPAMKHDHDVRTGKAAAAVHPLLDIKDKDRESRDSDAHPRSKSIVVMFDHTGSMGDIPALLQAELPKLMSLLVGKNYCEHPQVLFGCVGDAYDGSVAPLQVGQFESGNEMDDAFAAMLLERLGGGTNQESYELAMYYFARHVKMDCLEKRGEKGYCNTPDAPIWMADQTFRPIGEVQVGDKVMGWDHMYGRRCLVVTTVEAVRRRQADNVVQVTTASGRVLKCTADHQWLSGHHGSSGVDIWTEVQNRYGKGALLSHVIDPVSPLAPELRDDAAWLAGIYDGEGCYNTITQSGSHNPEVCSRIEQVMTRLGIEFHRDKTAMTYLLLGGLQTYVKLLNWLPITRRARLLEGVLISQSAKYVHGEQRPPTFSRTGDRVISIEPLPPQEVVSLQTTTHNYVAWGYASSNCFLVGDEAPYPAIDPDKVREIIGDDLNLETRMSTSAVVAELRKKFEVFFLIPKGSSNYGDATIRAQWASLAGAERVIDFDPRSACETIAATVGLMEGAIDAAGLRSDLADVGAAPATVASVTSGLAALAASATAIAKVGTGDLPARRGASTTVRL